MLTMFECWNGGKAVVDGNHPYFLFNFPATSPELLAFFQLSGRVWEVTAGVDCYLIMNNQQYDVPNFPLHEVNAFVAQMQHTMGYYPFLAPYQAPTAQGGFRSMGVVGWVNLGTGRADIYDPAVGFTYGPQAMMPQTQYQPSFYNQFNISLKSNGVVQGAGKSNTLGAIASTLKNVSSILHSGGEIWDFFEQRFDGGDNTGSW